MSVALPTPDGVASVVPCGFRSKFARGLTMWPSTAPWRPFASVIIALGLLQGAMVAAQLVRRGRRNDASAT